MISAKSKLAKKLYYILEDIDVWSKKPSEEILKLCIEDRLNASTKQHDDNISAMSAYVLTRSNLKVLKALARISNAKEKK